MTTRLFTGMNNKGQFVTMSVRGTTYTVSNGEVTVSFKSPAAKDVANARITQWMSE